MDENLSTIGEEDEATAAMFELNGGTRDDDNPDLIAKMINSKTPTRITLKLHVTANTYSIWETVLNTNNSTNMLYVAMPEKISHEASKHSFISLLEFAEEKLDCNAVILCMRKDRSDRAALVRTFLFLGFQPLSPASPLAPQNAAAALHSNVASSTITKGEKIIAPNDDEHLYLICHLDD